MDVPAFDVRAALGRIAANFTHLIANAQQQGKERSFIRRSHERKIHPVQGGFAQFSTKSLDFIMRAANIPDRAGAHAAFSPMTERVSWRPCRFFPSVLQYPHCRPGKCGKVIPA
ncbi:hypothetical protein [Mycoplana rhizolycopersici]|uniref:Uncharacterized protein n=1 Tax=Mycoplana rhizolycopersici TaxID=2746702 RepID=A0ABX2QJV9_9HYPH|nr:hypothetical protein [Rhizobium rhizolycopersici]NVP57182.1 hypothetical protein [Rhizobium rhizolycopersici]